MHHLPFAHLPFFVSILLLIILAKFFGEILARFRMPAMVGEIIAGIVLGPSILHIVSSSSDMKIISDLGVFMLIILAGLEIDVEEIYNSIRGKKAWVAVMGYLIPVILGLITGKLFFDDNMIIIFIALCIAVTALPVSVRILMDLGRLQSDIGRKIISTAIFNDVISLFILGVLLDVNTNVSGYRELVFMLSKTVIKFMLFTGLIVLMYQLFKKTKDKISIINKKLDTLLLFLKSRESLFAIVMVFILIFASISELLGMHFIIGAFFSAIVLNKAILGEENFNTFHKTTSSMTYGFLAPIFFALIGVELAIFSINNYLLLGVIILVAIISKIGGGYLGGRMAGLDRINSLTIGVGINGRGIMEIVIARIALEKGFIGIELFSILVIMAIITTILSPVLLKKMFEWSDRVAHKSEAENTELNPVPPS
jgi:Kef-type K+ transport system membrane component KefB